MVKLKTKFQIILTSSLSLVIAVVIDYNLQFNLASSLLYIIPIYLFSYQNKISFRYVVMFSLLAGFLWFFIELITHPYQEKIFLLWNSLTRIVIFLLISIILKRIIIEKEQKQVISKQKDELFEINQKLLESNNELNKLIGIAAHDIRNPVNGIMSFSEILMQDYVSATEEEMKIIKIIHDSSKFAMQILNDTLNISQINSGSLTLKRECKDYIIFVKECLAFNYYLAANKQQNIQFISTIDSILTSFDESRLQQAITNLITNAIKYSDFNTTIVVKVSIPEDNRGYLKTEVIDKGLGIDEKYKSEMFQPFATTSNIPTANESRTGLGLAITKRIIELHAGSIDFISEKDKGSDFFFLIPILAN
jgi:signal transduction histidine kinase